MARILLFGSSATIQRNRLPNRIRKEPENDGGKKNDGTGFLDEGPASLPHTSRILPNGWPVICRKLRNEWCRLAEHFCFLKDNTGADDCCDANKVRACSNPSAVVKENAPAIIAMIGASHTRNKCCSHDCHLRSRSFLDCTEAITPGTPHPDDQHWNKRIFRKGEFTEDSVRDECSTSRNRRTPRNAGTGTEPASAVRNRTATPATIPSRISPHL